MFVGLFRVIAAQGSVRVRLCSAWLAGRIREAKGVCSWVLWYGMVLSIVGFGSGKPCTLLALGAVHVPSDARSSFLGHHFAFVSRT